MSGIWFTRKSRFPDCITAIDLLVTILRNDSKDGAGLRPSDPELAAVAGSIVRDLWVAMQAASEVHRYGATMAATSEGLAFKRRWGDRSMRMAAVVKRFETAQKRLGAANADPARAAKAWDGPLRRDERNRPRSQQTPRWERAVLTAVIDCFEKRLGRDVEFNRPADSFDGPDMRFLAAMFEIAVATCRPNTLKTAKALTKRGLASRLTLIGNIVLSRRAGRPANTRTGEKR